MVTESVFANSRQMVLQALRDDGRASFAQIAKNVGLARHQVAAIVKAAVAEDELRLTVSISPDLLGLERFAYLQIVVSGPVQPVRDALVSMTESTFVADIAGHYSIDAEVRVGPDPHLRRTLDAILQLPGVSDIRTTLYESIEINRFSPFHTAKAPLTLDEADRSSLCICKGTPDRPIESSARRRVCRRAARDYDSNDLLEAERSRSSAYQFASDSPTHPLWAWESERECLSTNCCQGSKLSTQNFSPSPSVPTISSPQYRQIQQANSSK